MKIYFCLALGVCLFCSGWSAHAQTSAGTGEISGTVIDSSGAVVPNASVKVDNEKLGIHRELKTTGGGVFIAPALVPNSGYEVTVNASGFAEFQQRDITVLVGRNVSLPIALSVKTSATQVEVQDVAPVVEI